MSLSTTSYSSNTGFNAPYFKAESSDAIMGSSQEVNVQENTQESPHAIDNQTMTELARSTLSTKRKNPIPENPNRPLRRHLSSLHEDRNHPENAEVCGTSICETPCGKTKEFQKRQETALKFVEKRLIAKLKARKVRNSMVTTSQMHALLQKSVLAIEPAKMHEASRVLARQINEVVEDLSRYRGKSLQLKSMEKSYPFYSCDDTRTTQMLKLGFDCSFEASADGKHIDVFMMPAVQEPFAKGAFKEIFKAQSLAIPLKVELENSQNFSCSIYRRLGTCTPMVLLRVRKISEKSVKEGFKLQEKIQKLAPDAMFTSLPNMPPPPVLQAAAADPSEYRQKWYNTDLGKAYKYGSVPLSMGDHPKLLKPTIKDFLNIIIDVAKSLASWHKAGFVHRDVKPPNIFIQASDENTMTGILGDYDLSQKAGIAYSCKYDFWDALSEKGLATPFTDVFGLALSLATVTVPGFSFKKPLEILSEASQISYLSNALKQLFSLNINHEYMQNPKLTIAEFFQDLKQSLHQHFLMSEGDVKKKYLQGLDEIDLVVGVITLTAQIVAANQKFTQLEWTNRSLTAELFQDRKNDFSITRRAYCVAHDIKGCFNPDKNTFAELITSKILGWDKMPDFHKIQETKKLIALHLAKKTLGFEIQDELKQALEKIEARESALEFMEEISKLAPDDRSCHPLYHALNKPMMLETDEMIHDCTQNELTQIVLSEDSKVFDRGLDACNGLETNIARRKALKNLLLNILNDPDDAVDIKLEARETLNRIIRIEKAMNFAVETRDTYQRKVEYVIKKAPTMDMFLAELNAIKARLNLNSLPLPLPN